MASSQDYPTGIYGGGWWNPGRSLFPPCSVPLSDFMWLDSSLNETNEQADQMKQAATAASYSRSDDSFDDHHSSSADQHLHVISSDYVKHDSPNMSMFRPVVDDDKNTNNYNNSSNHGFYNQDQSDTTAKESKMGLENSASSYAHPAIIQTLDGPETDMMSYAFDNSFAPNWPKLLQSPSPNQQLNSGTKHTNTNNSMPFWDSWMGNDEIDTVESQQLPAPALNIEDQKTYNYEIPSSGSRLMSPKVGSKDIIAYKVASCSTKLGKKKKKDTTSDELYKRPRFETPSSLPTFKVRKEKLGDRITALQQLVSPFGKTDTASVLHEAIEYIKFLHDQVSVLRTSYMQNGTPTNQHQKMQGEPKNAGSEGPKQDLKSHGLCLVPMSITFPVANETTADFWTPTFGGTMTYG